jgi:hypothetical protein
MRNTWDVLKCGAEEGRKIIWTDCMKTEEVLQRVKEERNILHTIKRRKANWTGHTLRRNCLLNHVTEGKIWNVLEDEEEDVGSY